MKERRITNRFPSDCLVRYGRPGNYCVGVVKDISLDGLRLSCQQPLDLGEEIEIAPLDFNDASPVVCWVQWSEHSRQTAQAGLQFQAPVARVMGTWVGGLLRGQNDLLQRRSHVRVPLELPVTVSESGISVQGRLVDLCEGGGLLSCSSLFSTGTQLSLSAEGLDAVEAVVMAGRFAQDSWNYSLRFESLSSAQATQIEALCCGYCLA
ncbi:MAG: PilZ domain-containing protein [Vulcanimicrobiota bacterium]